MIADERDDAAAGAACLALEPHQVADDLERVGAAVDDVAGLDEHRSAPHPAPASIDQPRRRRDRAPHRIVAVKIADRDDALGRDGGLSERGRGQRGRGDEQEQAANPGRASARDHRHPRIKPGRMGASVKFLSSAGGLDARTRSVSLQLCRVEK